MALAGATQLAGFSSFLGKKVADRAGGAQDADLLPPIGKTGLHLFPRHIPLAALSSDVRFRGSLKSVLKGDARLVPEKRKGGKSLSLFVHFFIWPSFSMRTFAAGPEEAGF